MMKITQVVRHFAVFAKVFGTVLPLFDSWGSGGGGEGAVQQTPATGRYGAWSYLFLKKYRYHQ
jgi:hypothetical protein